jgi:thiol-disulfide isomerase/thioredoxin
MYNLSMKPLRFLPVLAILSVAVSAQAALNVGDKAPELRVTDWVKGSPVELGKGKPVVVEFWATWCGPCRQTIPHLTEMAKKYSGQVDFVGVSIWESQPGDYKTKVPAFVKEFGAKMEYNVATEGAGGYMAQNWMTAAGETGIPTAFLIDGSGKVAWIGHPMAGLEEAVDGVLSGKLDLVKARKAREEAKKAEAAEMAMQMEMQKKFAPVQAMFQKKDYKGAVAEISKLWAKEPKMRLNLGGMELSARKMGKLGGIDKLLAKLAPLPEMNDPMMINQVLWDVVENPGVTDAAGYQAAVKLGEKMMKLDPTNAMNMDTFALALWRAGDKAKAITTQKKAIELAKTDKRVDDQTRGEMEGRLREFGG